MRAGMLQKRNAKVHTKAWKRKRSGKYAVPGREERNMYMKK